MALKTMSVMEARSKMASVLDDAEEGRGTMIIRNSKETAAIVPAQFARLMPLVQELLSDLGESIEMSRDPEMLEQFRRGLADQAREDIVWYEE